MVFHLLFHLQRRLTPRQMKVVLLSTLLLLTFFLTTFNATLRFIVDSRVGQIAYLGQSSLGVQHHHSPQHAFSSSNDERSNDIDDKRVVKNTDEEIGKDDEAEERQWIRQRDRVKKYKTQQQKRRVEQLQKEQQEPTLGKYTTTIRMLDGFAMNAVISSLDQQQQQQPRSRCLDTPGWVDINGDGCEGYEETDLPGCPKYGNYPLWIGNMGSASENCCYCRPLSNPDDSINTTDEEEEEEVVLLRRPTITSYSQQRAKQSSASSSTILIADAHYAKALRMLQHSYSSSSSSSSDNDDNSRRITTTTDDKWNAVPHPIYNGEYTTSTNNRKRGDDFVHIDDYYNYDEYHGSSSSSSSSKGRSKNRRREIGSRGGGSSSSSKKKKFERRRSQMAQRIVAQTKTAQAAARGDGGDNSSTGGGVDVVNVIKDYIRNGGKYGTNEEELRQNVRQAIITAIENAEEDPPLFNMISEYIVDTIADMTDHVNEMFNVGKIMIDPMNIFHEGKWFWRKWWWYSDDSEHFEYEYDDTSEEVIVNSNNKAPSTSPTYYNSQREEDQFSLTDTHVVKGVLRTYRAIVRLLSSSIPRGEGERSLSLSSSKSSWRSIWRRESDDRQGNNRLFDSSDDYQTFSSSNSGDSHTSTDESGSTTTLIAKNNKKVVSLSRNDRIVIEGLFHLEKAAELGHAEAQRIVANSLASGILPLSDHSIMFRLAEWRYYRSQIDEGESEGGGDDDTSGGWSINNWTSTLLQTTIEVTDDFSSTISNNVGNNKTSVKARERVVNQRRQEQLSRAIVLWHFSAMSGNVESAMTLGYRHFYSAMGGSGGGGILSGAGRLFGLMHDDAIISPGYSMEDGSALGGTASALGSNSGSSGHYGVLGTCPTALAYYEAAAHGVMDELENGPTKAKMVCARYDVL